MTRKAALLAVLTATLLALSGVPAAGAGAVTAAGPGTSAGVGWAGGRTPAASNGRQTADLEIESIAPLAPREPTTSIKISGSFTNTGNAPLYSLRIRIRYSNQPFGGRADLETYASGQGAPDRASLSKSMQVPSVEAGAKVPFEFDVTPAGLGLFRFGVHPLAVEVVDAYGRQVALRRTFLPYMPKDTELSRTRLALALPIIDQPRRADDASFVDNDLKAALSRNGRLTELLAIAKGTSTAKNVTWFVDPALLDDLDAMTRPYKIRSASARLNQPAEPAAGQWLKDLTAALADTPVVTTPYADPDVSALAHSGLDHILRSAVTTGAAVTSGVLGREVRSDINWPITGRVDWDTLDALAVTGARTLLLDSANLPPGAPPVAGSTAEVTPDAAATLPTVSGPVTAVVVDPVLSKIVETSPATPGDAVLARQRFVAETALIAAERPDTATSVVAAPSRRWDPDPAFVVDLVRSTASLPWLTPTPLASITAGATAEPRAEPVYADQDRRRELPQSYLDEIRKVADAAALTARITGGDDGRVFDRAVFRLASSAWRGQTRTARTVTDQVSTVVDDRLKGVTVVTGAGARTLAGADGVVPISVSNELADQVTIDVEVVSEQPDLLQVVDYEPKRLVIAPRQNHTVQVSVAALRSGESTVTVQLKTPDGKNYDKPATLTVRTTGYTGIALVIVGAALSVMLAAVVLRLLRRRSARATRASRRRAGAPAVPDAGDRSEAGAGP